MYGSELMLTLCACLLCACLLRFFAGLSADMLATDLAEYLVRKGVPFRETHHISGEGSRFSTRLTQDPCLGQAWACLESCHLWYRRAHCLFALNEDCCSPKRPTYLMSVLRPLPPASGATVKMAEDRGCTLFDLSVKDLQSIHPLFGEDVTQVTCSAGTLELPDKQSQGRVRHGISVLLTVAGLWHWHWCAMMNWGAFSTM